MEVLKDTKGIDIKPPASLYLEGMVKTWYVKKKKKTYPYIAVYKNSFEEIDGDSQMHCLI